MESILNVIKKLLGVEPEVPHFDMDIMMHINAAIMRLTQLGVGPSGGYRITGASETWADFIGDRIDIEGVKLYIYLKAKLMFDPPTSSYVLDAMNRSIQEMEWTLNVQVDKPE